VNLPAPTVNVDGSLDLSFVEKNPLRIAQDEYLGMLLQKLDALRSVGDSAGGIVSCCAWGLPPGLGEPVFDKLDALLAQAMLSLGACKGVEFGSGFASAFSTGSMLNDTAFSTGSMLNENSAAAPAIPNLTYKTNNAGGILGGISTGQPLEFRAAFKPVPSIAAPQQIVDRTGAVRQIAINGRHDICIVPRAVPIVEAMTALVLADLTLQNDKALQK
jgi:chorismate synthase